MLSWRLAYSGRLRFKAPPLKSFPWLVNSWKLIFGIHPNDQLSATAFHYRPRPIRPGIRRSQICLTADHAPHFVHQYRHS